MGFIGNEMEFETLAWRFWDLYKWVGRRMRKVFVIMLRNEVSVVLRTQWTHKFLGCIFRDCAAGGDISRVELVVV